MQIAEEAEEVNTSLGRLTHHMDTDADAMIVQGMPIGVNGQPTLEGYTGGNVAIASSVMTMSAAEGLQEMRMSVASSTGLLGMPKGPVLATHARMAISGKAGMAVAVI